MDSHVKGGQRAVSTLSLAEAKVLFLRDIRLLSQETQRWHKENLTAFENAGQPLLIGQSLFFVESFNIPTPIYPHPGFLV